MTTTNETKQNELSLDVLRSLAFMQHQSEDYFVYNGKAYTGNHKELRKEWIECTEQLADAQTWDEFIEDNCIEIEEFDNDDYMVLTDEEANEKATEYIKDSLWAFNPSFLADMTDFDEEIFQAIADNGKCESNNDVIYNTIQKTCGIDEFVEAAVQADGRGHFMSSYDGEEDEQTVSGITCEDDGEDSHTFYIYRMN